MAYIRLSPGGQQLYATYLPFEGTIQGLDSKGPILELGGQRYHIDESQPNGVFAGCGVNAASFDAPDTVAPGEIVSIFGTGLGPRQGVAFTLKDGQVPTSLGGTQVLVNGEPVPLLYASYEQVNAILPFTLVTAIEFAKKTIQVKVNGAEAIPLTSLATAYQIGIFRNGGSAAAALNQDGTINSPANPAKAGSHIALFGTGGGQTTPASTAGQVTPLEAWPLQNQPVISPLPPGTLKLDYAGAAPGLPSGVTQINVKLPDTIPQLPGFPAGVLTLVINGSDYVTIAVE